MNAGLIMYSVTSVCLWCLSFYRLQHWPRKVIAGRWVHLQNFTVKIIHEGHQIKVMVTGTKRHEISSLHPFCGRHGTVLLQLQWRQVHFSHSGYDTTCLRSCRVLRECNAGRLLPLAAGGCCADFKLLIRRQTACVCVTCLQLKLVFFLLPLNS